jgi:hypothetical protein
LIGLPMAHRVASSDDFDPEASGPDEVTARLVRLLMRRGIP